MPTYTYECKKCGHTQDIFHSMSETRRVKCEDCGGMCRRLLGRGAGLIFKGSGFYETDYKRSGNGKGEKKGEGEKRGEGAKSEGGKSEGAKSEGGSSESSSKSESSKSESSKSNSGTSSAKGESKGGGSKAKSSGDK